MQFVLRFVKTERGATAVEYAVMLSLILISILGAIASVGSQTGGMWGGIVRNIEAYFGTGGGP
jgi:pilus assembly protein Flp/PilA